MWIETYSGIKFDYLKPTPEMISIEDISHSLANLCRYTGHTPISYSVAEHSFLMSTVVPDELKKYALMHDAAEAYVGDVNAPLKSLLEEFKKIEERVLRVISERYQLDYSMFEDIKIYDVRMLKTERIHLFKKDDWEDLKNLEPLPVIPGLCGIGNDLLKRTFKNRAKELGIE